MKTNKKTVEDSRAESVYSVLPADTNIYGNLFGGKLVEWIDSIGALVTHRHSSKNVVTANIDNLSFLEPIRLGDSVILHAWINYVGTTSMEVQVDTYREKKDDSLRALACTAFLTYVAIDEYDKPTPIPDLILKTEKQKKRFKEAQQRKEIRLKKKV